MKHDKLPTGSNTWYAHNDLAPSQDVAINNFKKLASSKIDQIQSDNHRLQYPDAFQAERLERLTQLTDFVAKLATLQSNQYDGVTVFDLNVDLNSTAHEDFQDSKNEINNIFKSYNDIIKTATSKNYPDRDILQVMESIRNDTYQESEWGKQTANEDLLDILTNGASSKDENQHDRLGEWHFFDTSLPGIGVAIRRHNKTEADDDLVIYLKDKLADRKSTRPSLPQ